MGRKLTPDQVADVKKLNEAAKLLVAKTSGSSNGDLQEANRSAAGTVRRTERLLKKNK